ncbi:MAG: hypothetical protein U0M02_02440 [Acutalibacteraceae bacterium]|nr:hypothetical protein [Acutalibacteraceae bacterium]
MSKSTGDFLRIGKISSCNYEKGLARIVYADRDDCTTIELPFMCPFEEYYVPEVDDLVWVLHLPNGSSKGLILGRYWSKNHTPPDGVKQGIRRKDFSREQGKCYWQYDDTEVGEGNEGKMLFHNDDDVEVTVDGDLKEETKGDVEKKSEGDYTVKSEGTLNIKGVSAVKVESDGSVTIKASGGITISSDAGVTIKGNGNTTVDGLNFLGHKHNCTAPGSLSGTATV